MKIAKLDAARRQLETAVALYFHQADPVSVHTLTAAAYDVLRDLNKTTSSAPMIKDWAPTYIKDEYVDEFRRKLNEAQNFFKHADKDPEHVLNFQPDQSELLLLDACWTYKKLAGERLPLLGAFEMWAWATFASGLVSYEGEDSVVEVRDDVSRMSRQEFLRTTLPVAYEAMFGRRDT